MNLQLLVNVIKEAIDHGADAGGSYDENEKKLAESIREFLDDNGLFYVKIVFNNYRGFECLINSNTNELYKTSETYYPDIIYNYHFY